MQCSLGTLLPTTTAPPSPPTPPALAGMATTRTMAAAAAADWMHDALRPSAFADSAGACRCSAVMVTDCRAAGRVQNERWGSGRRPAVSRRRPLSGQVPGDKHLRSRGPRSRSTPPRPPAAAVSSRSRARTWGSPPTPSGSLPGSRE